MINYLSSDRLLQRLNQFSGAKKEANSICDEDFAQECADITDIILEVMAHREAHQWIDCVKRRPVQERDQRYIPLNLLLNGRTVVQGGFDDGSFWLDGVRIDNVTHWMPMPAPIPQECVGLPEWIDQLPGYNRLPLPVLPDYVFHTLAVNWPLTAEQIKRLCRELQLEMEKHQ
ncbi:DUF551 domain-containing protein [Salmonella enterica]|nr:DUF551 domain-containing protein [Salmonella enterica]